MDDKSLLFQFLEEEKNRKPSPLLEERIMARINGAPDSVTLLRPSLWIRITAVAACVVIVIAIGISTGKNYSVPAAASISWNINDSQIENLALYETGNG